MGLHSRRVAGRAIVTVCKPPSPVIRRSIVRVVVVARGGVSRSLGASGISGSARESSWFVSPAVPRLGPLPTAGVVVLSAALQAPPSPFTERAYVARPFSVRRVFFLRLYASRPRLASQSCEKQPNTSSAGSAGSASEHESHCFPCGSSASCKKNFELGSRSFRRALSLSPAVRKALARWMKKKKKKKPPVKKKK